MQDSSLFTSPIPHACTCVRTHTYMHTHIHAHTHTQHTHSVYFKLIVIITPQMSYYQRTLPMSSGHSQSSQVTCENKSSLSHFSPLCLLENTPPPSFYFGDTLDQPLYLAHSLISHLSPTRCLYLRRELATKY